VKEKVVGLRKKEEEAEKLEERGLSSNSIYLHTLRTSIPWAYGLNT
jgi:hypothetical protein